MSYMPTKNLRAYTIVPDELYVRRSADAQLQGVIQNMGRPGYVLVARQMGKTNLLLNAKRELGAGEDIFVYVDLSNSYPTLSQFFRNIIDTAIDSEPERLYAALGEVQAFRNSSRGLPDHKEHEQELRILLRCTTGKIVICLDEIDALTKSGYSDNVFSLIRSTYFASRINFAEFNRLTYILSGVAEPSELIKNKAISPFNIGEKIYLDDFTFEEYVNFLSCAKLNFNNDVVKRIFSWTSGNPRICWDLCSSLEDILLAGNDVKVDDVDSMVRRLYLSTYDMAPVDHIRQLVAEDKEIRTAVLNIHQGKYSAVSDAYRTKLYLAGIVKADFSSSEIKIKNQVIAESLSLDWIKSIEESKLSIIAQAEAKLAEQDYEDALSLYKKVLEEVVGSVDSELLYHNMGECCVMLGDYQGAIEYLTKFPIKKSKYALLFYRQHLWLGISLYRIGDIEGSIERLNSIIDSDFPEGYPLEYYEAIINRIAPYSENFNDYSSKIVDDCKVVIKGLAEVEDSYPDRIDRILCAAYGNIVEALNKLGRVEEALAVLRQGIHEVGVTSKPTLMLKLIDLSSNEEKLGILLNIVQLVESGEINFTKLALHAQINFSERIFAELIVRSLVIDKPDAWERIRLLLNESRFELDSIKEILNYAAIIAIRSRVHGAIKPILRATIQKFKRDVDPKELRALSYFVLVIEDDEDAKDLESEFLHSFESADVSDLNEHDLVTIYTLAERFLQHGCIEDAERTISYVMRRKADFLCVNNAEMKLCIPVIDFLQLGILSKTSDKAKVEAYARMLLSSISDELKPPKLFAEDYFAEMRSELREVIGFKSLPVKAQKKFGRNDFVECKYEDGTVVRKKYKHVQQDLSQGLCELIN